MGFVGKSLPLDLDLQGQATRLTHEWARSDRSRDSQEFRVECDALLDKVGPGIWSRDAKRCSELVTEIESGSPYTEHLFFDDSRHREW